MEEQLTASQTSVCMHCKRTIKLYWSDLRIRPFGWLHEHSGHEACDDARKATPVKFDQQAIQDEVARRQQRVDDQLGKLNG